MADNKKKKALDEPGGLIGWIRDKRIEHGLRKYDLMSRRPLSRKWRKENEAQRRGDEVDEEYDNGPFYRYGFTRDTYRIKRLERIQHGLSKALIDVGPDIAAFALQFREMTNAKYRLIVDRVPSHDIKKGDGYNPALASSIKIKIISMNPDEKTYKTRFTYVIGDSYDKTIDGQLDEYGMMAMWRVKMRENLEYVKADVPRVLKELEKEDREQELKEKGVKAVKNQPLSLSEQIKYGELLKVPHGKEKVNDNYEHTL